MADILEVNTRKFVREFTSMKDLAASGLSIRVVEGGRVWKSELERGERGFLGATKGTLVYQAPPDLLLGTGESWGAER